MRRNGYSLIEVLVAAAVVAIAIGGAAVLAHSTLLQKEIHTRGARAANLQEQISTLYRLGYSSTAITNILGERFTNTTPGSNQYRLDFAAPTNTISGPTTNVETSQCTLTFHAATTSGGIEVRSNSIILVRPTIR